LLGVPYIRGKPTGYYWRACTPLRDGHKNYKTSVLYNSKNKLPFTLAASRRVLNPLQLAFIYRSMKNTDKEDALKLAHIIGDYKDERLPVVPIPSNEEMRRRKIAGRDGKGAKQA